MKKSSAKETKSKGTTPDREITDEIKNVLNENKNIRNIFQNIKNIGSGYRRLFMAIYVLGLGTVFIWLLSRYGLVEMFVTYLAIFSVFYWILVALFIWVMDGFEKK